MISSVTGIKKDFRLEKCKKKLKIDKSQKKVTQFNQQKTKERVLICYFGCLTGKRRWSCKWEQE